MIEYKCLLLQKGVYSYEYVDDWQKFNETWLPEKKRFLHSLKYGRYYKWRLRMQKVLLNILKCKT